MSLEMTPRHPRAAAWLALAVWTFGLAMPAAAHGHDSERPLSGRLRITDAGRGSSELFAQYFGLTRADLEPHRLAGDNAVRMQLLAKQPDAIVYLSVGEAEHNVRAGAPIRPLAVAGVAATSRNILTGNYPIARPLSLVTRGRPAGLAAAFIDFCVSSRVTDIVVAHDFAPYLD